MQASSGEVQESALVCMARGRVSIAKVSCHGFLVSIAALFDGNIEYYPAGGGGRLPLQFSM